MTRRLLVFAAVVICVGVASPIVVSLWDAHRQITTLTGSSEYAEARQVAVTREIPDDSFPDSQKPSLSPVVPSAQTNSTGTGRAESPPQMDVAERLNRSKAANGGSLAACRQMQTDSATENCKILFEERDAEWAPEAERLIQETVWAMGVVRLTTNRQYLELRGRPAAECLKTICRMVFEFNVPAVIDYLSANDRWDATWPRSANTRGFKQFLDDYALEVRDALVVDGLATSEWGVGRSGGINPVLIGDPDVSSATYYIYRCGRLADSCSQPEGQDQR